MLNKLFSHECLRRAARTFLQTACGTLGAGLVAVVTNLIHNVENWKAILLSFLAAVLAGGISAAMNLPCMKDSSDDE